MPLTFAQDANSTIPPNAIRTPSGGWITPPQTADQSGKNLTIHYETGTPVQGNYANSGPPPDPVLIVDSRNQIDNFLTNHEILIHYDAYDGISGFSPLDLEIRISNGGSMVFDDIKHLVLDGTGPKVAFWRFIPTKPGNYTLEKFNNGIHTSTMLFSVSSSSESLTSPVLVPPLKQIRAEIPPQDVECRSDLRLMIKASDGSAICIRPQTAQNLAERGWATAVTYPVSLPSIAPTSDVSTHVAGQKVGAFTISKINPDNVTGYYNSPYPIERPGLGDYTTMHVGDTLNPTCDGSAPLVITAINYPYSITVTAGKPSAKQYGGCPICLSADSTIRTPTGDVNVKDIKDGMTVWSTDSDGMAVKSKVIKTGSVFVGHMHMVIDLQLADGRKLFVSPNHPTYDGRIVADLKVGERYDGSTVKSAEIVQYRHQFTYDILPSSQTGNYWANGILVGSTLKH